MHVGEKWQFTGGVRYDVVDVDYLQTMLTSGAVSEIAADDRMLSWRAGAVYKPSRTGSLYAGLGTSFNPSVDAAATGAALSTAATAANNPNLEPEETRNYEVGTKWDVARNRLAVTGAVFRTEKRNARTRNATSDPFVLSGRQRVSGVELGVSGSITPVWTALLSYTFMDSEFAASANAAEEGQNLTLTPEHALSIWTTYRLQQRITVGGGAQYMDAVFRNSLNTQRVPSYWLASALVTYDVNQLLTLRVNVQNLTDEQYVDRVGGGHYIPGPRRQIIISSDLRF
jgi:catecholate siderophore receptor